MSELRFDAVVFDFDGLILDTEGPEFRACQLVYEVHGHRLALADWAAAIGTHDGFDPHAHLEGLLGAPLDAADLREIFQARKDELMATEVILPGVIAWLDAAEDLDLGVAIASSSSARSGHVEGHLARLDLRHRFAHVSCWTEDVRPKPAPDLYLAATAALAVDPARAIAVEDSPNGIAAAKAAGLWCLAVPNPLTAALDLSAADALAASLAE